MPFSRVHNKAKLQENASCMKARLDLRVATERLSFHRNTAFRYRLLMMFPLDKD